MESAVIKSVHAKSGLPNIKLAYKCLEDFTHLTRTVESCQVCQCSSWQHDLTEDARSIIESCIESKFPVHIYTYIPPILFSNMSIETKISIDFTFPLKSQVTILVGANLKHAMHSPHCNLVFHLKD